MPVRSLIAIVVVAVGTVIVVVEGNGFEIVMVNVSSVSNELSSAIGRAILKLACPLALMVRSTLALIALKPTI